MEAALPDPGEVIGWLHREAGRGSLGRRYYLRVAARYLEAALDGLREEQIHHAVGSSCHPDAHASAVGELSGPGGSWRCPHDPPRCGCTR